MLHSLASREPDEHGIEVECISLARALAEVDTCDFLKLDCEGGEYEILYPAPRATISKIGRLVCEFDVLDNKQRNGNGIRDFLIENGFQVDELRLLNESSGFICARRI